MQRRDPLTFRWLGRKRKNKSRELAQLLSLDYFFPCSLSIKKQCFGMSKLNLPLDQKAMVIFDVFKGHVTEKVASVIEENNCVIIYVPNNLTDQFQLFNLNVIGHSKQFLKKKFGCWYSQQICHPLEDRTNVYDVQVPFKLSIIKPIHA